MAEHGWMSGSWFLRDDDTLWLIPGDSPMGLRLPLDSVPWVAEKDFPWLRQQDPSNPNCRNCRRNFRIARRVVGRADAPTLPGDGPRPTRAKTRCKPRRSVRRPSPRSGAKRAVDHPHRAVRRAARWTAACLHAAGGEDGRLSRSHRRHRNHRRRNWVCRSSSKAKRRRAIRA